MNDAGQNCAAPEKTGFRGYMKQQFTAKNIAYFGVLIALEIVLQLWGSSISIGGGATLNFSLIPIVLGAMLLGPFAGGLLGLISGVMILVAVIQGLNGPVFLYLFNEQPAVISLICLLKTTVAGAVAGLLYMLINKKNKHVAVFVASLSVPVINTGLFILGCLCMPGAMQSAMLEFGLDTYSSVFSLIIFGFVTFNFFIEFAINLICAPGLYTVVRVVEKQIAAKAK